LLKNWQVQGIVREQNSGLYLKKKLSKWGKNYPSITVYFEMQREEMPKEIRDSSSEIYSQTINIT